MLASVFVLLSLRLSLVLAITGSPDAGATVSAVYPPPGASSIDSADFPNANEVGYPGPTVSEYCFR